jgi:hypothetical protein
VIPVGLPAPSPTHELAQAVAPDCAVAYADHDPLVLVYARALLTARPPGRCGYVHADLRDPTTLLTQASATLDLARPVGVLLLAVLHFITFSDRRVSDSSSTRGFTSRTCSRRPGQEISDEEAGSMAGSAGPLSVVANERREHPWPGRLSGPGCSDEAARRTSRTPQGPVGKITDTDHPSGIVAALARAMAPGSYLAISHLTADLAPGPVTAAVEAYNAAVPGGVTARSHTQVTALFGGLPLVPPGVVPVTEWRPTTSPAAPSADLYAGIAHTPHTCASSTRLGILIG